MHTIAIASAIIGAFSGIPLGQGFTVLPSIVNNGIGSRSTINKGVISQFHVSSSSSNEDVLSQKKRNSSIDNKSKTIYSSPAAQFGQPISPQITDFNKAAITFVKDTVFDAIFPQETTSFSILKNQEKEDDKSTTIYARAYARFYALETIARMPYFAYLSVLHLYETLGWFRKVNYLKLHFAESWNELHHLLIMEELGGNDKWSDRFVAQHTAFFYYWFVVSIYMINPILAYNLNQAVEEHAYETYDSFLTTNEEYLKSMEAPEVAKNYYAGDDLYLLDEMQTNLFKCNEEGQIQLDGMVRSTPIKCETLYDVFSAIRDDEAEHVKTMAFLQNQDSDIDLDVKPGEECEIDLDALAPSM